MSELDFVFQGVLGPGHSDQRCDPRASSSEPPPSTPRDRVAESATHHQTAAALPRAVLSA